ncbi:MAG: tRNA epoxyqueuosine(34) reductase QueG [Sediminibacterium sp.]|nr:tRNA epoxyqueuosine(34) reductase QueG [Sediminibacterium sp.]
MVSAIEKSRYIKTEALKLGFDYCGIAKADHLPDDEKRLAAWLNQGYHGKMKYMENHFDMRVNPKKLFPNAQSIISLSLNYFPKDMLKTEENKIAKYAYGQDYHKVIKNKLTELILTLKNKFGHFEGRCFVDSAPILEKTWAQKSGMGWIGKNGNLIKKSQGSFFFIAQLIVDFPCDYDPPFEKDFCGTCQKCIDACPTDAILFNKTIKADSCISYFTIELKEKFEKESNVALNQWIFGCDICQDVCPWNSFSKPHQIPELQLNDKLIDIKTSDWLDMSEEIFTDYFGKSAFVRTKLTGMKRNVIKNLQNSSQ